MDNHGRKRHQDEPDFDRIGISGSGIMGSGIALAALLAGLKVVLYDIDTAFLDRALEYIEKHLAKKQRLIDMKYLRVTTALDDLRGCGIVIEAAPEDLKIKKELFAKLSAICPPPAVLATNTSTLSVTAIASAARDPAQVGGMHFFNPAPVMPLVEVVRGALTSPETENRLARLAKKLGKQAVIARDTPGFIVNRVARPFYGEALRILSEGTASHEQIDRIVRMGGGFRMGPFELMDLIGIDINFAAAQSVYEQTFYEPRYRPSPIQAQMVHQNALGRKSGRGFYRYEGVSEPKKPSEDTPRLPYRNHPQDDRSKVILSQGTWAPGLARLLEKSPYRPGTLSEGTHAVFAGVAAAGKLEGLEKIVSAMDLALPGDAPLLVQCGDTMLGEAAAGVERPERLIGFDGLFLGNGPIVTLTALEITSGEMREKAERFFNNLGCEVSWIEDSPGLVLPRLICCLANEAAFTAGEGTADPDTIDIAMKLGTNYPRGPLEWAKEIGYQRVVEVLDHLHREYGEERYRVAPLLKRWARLERIAR